MPTDGRPRVLEQLREVAIVVWRARSSFRVSVSGRCTRVDHAGRNVWILLLFRRRIYHLHALLETRLQANKLVILAKLPNVQLHKFLIELLLGFGIVNQMSDLVLR